MATRFVLALAFAAQLLTLALGLQCTGCAKPGDVCCLCTAAARAPICLWNDKFCRGGTFCDGATNLCTETPPPVATQSEDCGRVGVPCCDIVTRVGGPVRAPCLGKNVCASGTCVDPKAPVLIEQTDACIGAWEDCDENYLCVTRGKARVCVPA